MMYGPPLPPGQPPPEDLQRFIAEQNRRQEIQAWYEGQLQRLETEARERMLKFAPVMCRCLDREPCPVHSTVHISTDGRVL
jgi:hypothetical protein